MVSVATATSVPTFTATLVPLPPVIPPTETPTPLPPTATNTPVIMSDEQRRAMEATQTAQAQQPEQPTETDSPGEAQPEPPTNTPVPQNTRPVVTASESNVNLRTGPGTNYPKSGFLAQGQSLDIVGRNNDSSWWQVSTTDGLRWIAVSVTSSSNTDNTIPVVDAPPPPVTPTPVPPTATPVPPQPQYQYTIHNVFWKENKGLTQIRGHIQDTNGNAVNGTFVRVRSGSFCTVSFGSGPGEGNYPAGNYDIVLWPNGERPGTWDVDIVPQRAPNDSEACHGLSPLSETKNVHTSAGETIVYVEWDKNW